MLTLVNYPYFIPVHVQLVFVLFSYMLFVPLFSLVELPLFCSDTRITTVCLPSSICPQSTTHPSFHTCNKKLGSTLLYTFCHLFMLAQLPLFVLKPSPCTSHVPLIQTDTRFLAVSHTQHKYNSLDNVVEDIDEFFAG